MEMQEMLRILVTTFTSLGRSVKASNKNQKLKHGEFALVNILNITDPKNTGVKISLISKKLQVAQPTITPMVHNL